MAAEGTNLVNGGNISGATTNMLTIASVATNNAGDFTLLATNTYGAVTSSVVTLTVLLPPTITGATAAGGGVTLQFTGGYSSTYVLESTTNMLSGAWEPVVTNTVDVTCQWQFTDTQVTNYSQRFFRLKLVQ